MTNTTQIRQLNSDLAEYFRDVPVDQGESSYKPGKPCCVGAHLAHYLKRGVHYLTGADAWADAMGGSRAHAVLMLRAAGAAHNPFGVEDWPVEPHEVFSRLAREYESLPDLSGADLSFVNLPRAGLGGADLEGATLSLSDLTNAYLSGAGLSGAILVNAVLCGADMTGADLRHACLRDADLYEANLRCADLTGADLSGAMLKAADLTGAKLEGSVMLGADTMGANLTGTILDPINNETDEVTT